MCPDDTSREENVPCHHGETAIACGSGVNDPSPCRDLDLDHGPDHGPDPGHGHGGRVVRALYRGLYHGRGPDDPGRDPASL